MLSEPATVVDASADVLELQSGRRSACSGCSLKPGCGHHLFASPDETLRLNTGDFSCAGGVAGLAPGTELQLQVEAGQVLRLTLFFHVLPLAGLLLGTGAAVLLGLGEVGAMAAACIGLLAGLFHARNALRRQRKGLKLTLTPQAAAAEESCS